MYTDKKILYTFSGITLAALLLALLLPGEHSGRFISAALLLPLAVLTALFIKKRSILSLNKKEVLLITVVIGAVYLTAYYLTGIKFHFLRNIYVFNIQNVISFVIPITVIIVTSEVLRYVIRAQGDKLADALCYLSCVIAEVLVYGNIHYINSFNRFMDFVGLTLFPAIITNLLFHYLSKRYGMYPNISYRVITTLYLYFIPYVPAMSDSLYSLYKLAFPIATYVFIDALYEKKRKRALKPKSKLALPLTVVSAAFIIAFVMLISNQFRYGMLVIATPSMTGELNVGDAAVFERYDDQIIIEGQVIVFEKDGSMIVHRVAKIEKINGITRYYTKGDANDGLDPGYIYDSDVVGLVHLKVPYVGYPTIWMRSLFITEEERVV